MTDVISTPPRRYWLASQHPTADRKACQIGRGVPPHRRKGSATRPKRKRPPRRSRNWWLNWSSSVGDQHFRRATRGHSPRILAARRPRSAAPDSLVSWLSTPVCTLVEGHVGTAIAQLKEMDGPEIQVQGSGNLVQTLLSEDLVDGLHLLFIQSCSAGASGCSRRAYPARVHTRGVGDLAERRRHGAIRALRRRHPRIIRVRRVCRDRGTGSWRRLMGATRRTTSSTTGCGR